MSTLEIVGEIIKLTFMGGLVLVLLACLGLSLWELYKGVRKCVRDE